MLTFSGVGLTLVIISSIKLYRSTKARLNSLPSSLPSIASEQMAPSIVPTSISNPPSSSSFEQGSSAPSNATTPRPKRKTWEQRRQEFAALSPPFSADSAASPGRKHWDKSQTTRKFRIPPIFVSRLPRPAAHFNSFLVPHPSPDSLKSDQSPCSSTRRPRSLLSTTQRQSRIPVLSTHPSLRK
ncbi:MAG: hypothetical protein JSR97_11780 [Verrucomicrobia bacterium]|nr:hypothetical protein [Verrucomicrobiota bacterium]